MTIAVIDGVTYYSANELTHLRTQLAEAQRELIEARKQIVQLEQGSGAIICENCDNDDYLKIGFCNSCWQRVNEHNARLEAALTEAVGILESLSGQIDPFELPDDCLAINNFLSTPTVNRGRKLLAVLERAQEAVDKLGVDQVALYRLRQALDAREKE